MSLSFIRFQAARSLQNGINGILSLLERFCWPSKLPPSDIRTICVNRVGQVGDMICAVPAMYAIRLAFPSAKLTLLSTTANTDKPGAEQLLAGAEWIDRLWVYQAKDLKSWQGLKAFYRKLRAEQYDLWIELPQDLSSVTRLLRNMLFVKWVGVRWARGFRFNNLRLFARDQARHHQTVGEAQRLLNYLPAFGIPVSEGAFPLPIKDADVRKADEVLAGLSVNPSQLLAVAPGGKRATNLWPVDRFAEIARRWVLKGGKVLILGGPDEIPLGEIIQRAAPPKIVNLCGQTTLLQAIELLRRCRLLVSNDSGPVHMASAVGTPCVIAYTASQLPWHWAPWGKNHRLIRKEVHCSPCFLAVCPENNLCLTEVPIDEIWDAVQKTVMA